jgi:hypothetical protein
MATDSAPAATEPAANDIFSKHPGVTLRLAVSAS